MKIDVFYPGDTEPASQGPAPPATALDDALAWLMTLARSDAVRVRVLGFEFERIGEMWRVRR